MLNNIDWSLFIYVGAIACIMLANTFLGVVRANKCEEFSWKELGKGLFKYSFVLIAVCLLFVAGNLIPDFSVVLPKMENALTIIDMLIVVSVAICAKYIKSCYDNLIAIFSCEDEIRPVNPGNCGCDDKPIGHPLPENSNCISGNCSNNGNMVG